jgi:hypothetical protein
VGNDLGSSYVTEQAAAKQMLGFAAVVVPAPQQRAHTVDDEPDHYGRHVATIAAPISRLALPLSTLSSIAASLEASEGVPWGRLADEPRRDYRDFSDLHFAALVLATVEAIREVGLTLPARNHVDSVARLKLFAMGLGVLPEHREKIRALLRHDIDLLISFQLGSTDE